LTSPQKIDFPTAYPPNHVSREDVSTIRSNLAQLAEADIAALANAVGKP
jgi:hypothetical protein